MHIVALSDQHGYLPEISPCDLLIVAGDVCPDRVGPVLAVQDPDQQKAWFDRTARAWLETAPAIHKVLTWGNHDWCGQACHLAAPTARLQILVDDAITIRIGDRSVTVWATPWSNTFMSWAFMKEPSELSNIYAAIPEGVDILVSHQPPFGYGDHYVDRGSGKTLHLGSHELLAAIERVRPELVICGHIHDGYGRHECNGIPIYNVSVVDEQYNLAHPPTSIVF